MSRISPLRLLMGLLALAIVSWLAVSLEWVEVEVPRPKPPELEADRFFLVEKLLVRLGAAVTRPGNLDTLPPPGARLLLATTEWDLFDSRAERLKDWVEQGGHLVASADLLDEEELEAWLPMQLAPRKGAEPAARPLPRSARLAECRQLTDAAAPAARAESLSLCAPRLGYGDLDLVPEPPANPLWRLQGPAGTEMLRMPVGRGSVTLVRPWGLMAGERLLEGDNTLAFARMLQVGPGAAVWIVDDETREPLPLWIWRHAASAVLLALAALALYLWRGAVRFGPLVPAAVVQHRSIADQVTGTGRFLQHHGGAALHAAQCRALAEAVRRRLPGATAITDHERLLAIASAGDLDARALADAMAPGHAHRPAALPTTLALLETARRRVLARRPAASKEDPP